MGARTWTDADKGLALALFLNGKSYSFIAQGLNKSRCAVAGMFYRHGFKGLDRDYTLTGACYVAGNLFPPSKPVLRELQTLVSKQAEWEPIATAPKDGSEIVIKYRETEKRARFRPDGRYKGGGVWALGDDFCVLNLATHWKPVRAAFS